MNQNAVEDLISSKITNYIYEFENMEIYKVVFDEMVRNLANQVDEKTINTQITISVDVRDIAKQITQPILSRIENDNDLSVEMKIFFNNTLKDGNYCVVKSLIDLYHFNLVQSVAQELKNKYEKIIPMTLDTYGCIYSITLNAINK